MVLVIVERLKGAGDKLLKTLRRLLEVLWCEELFEFVANIMRIFFIFFL